MLVNPLKMLKYIAKTEIGGIEIRLINSESSFVVIYGMTKETYETEKQAWRGYRDCVDHAAGLLWGIKT